MKASKVNMIGWMILSMALPGAGAEETVPAPYMGQKPPGFVPKVFAPGLLSLPNRFEHGLCLSKDGRECYFAVRAANWSTSQIMVMRYEDGQWSTAVKAPFSDNQSIGPDLADNDQSLYFSRSLDIWRVRRTAQGWSQPEIVPAPVSSAQADYSSQVSNLGNLWTCSWRTGGVGGCDVWRVPCEGGEFQEATNLTILNASANDCAPAPGPNEDYVVFHSDRAGGCGGADLYISFPNGQGGWTPPRNLGPTINSSGNDVVPYISPDRKYLFFSRDETSTEENVYWVRVEAFLPDPNGPIYNLSTGQRFAGIQAAINQAESGQVIMVSPGTYHENLILPNLPLTIRSANAQDSAVVSLTTLPGDRSSPVVTLAPGSALRSLQGLTITGGANGIVCSGARLQLSSCIITGHRDSGIEVSEESTLGLDHCILAGNAGAGLQSVPKTATRGPAKLSKVDLTQCTIVQNRHYALDGDGITMANSILYGNGASAESAQIKGSSVKVSYCDVQGGCAGQGNLDADPAFVTAGTWTDPNTYVVGDFHLKSKAGHWDSRACSWVLDDATSPCIDVGDPSTTATLEPLPNGDRVNLAAYGGTTEASKSPSK
jgi:hypothetical protein